MLVSLYARMSLDRENDQLGVSRQLEECRTFVESRGWRIEDEFVDNDISATSGKVRPQFERLIASDPEAIVCWHTDRLVRLSRDLERVIDLEVNVYAVQAGHLDLSTPAGRAVAKTVTAWAQYETEQKAVRQKAAHRQRARAGKQWWNHRPFGYEKDGTLRDPEAGAVREGYDMLLADESLGSIARRWTELGLTTTHGGTWTGVEVGNQLRNPRFAAIRTYQGEEIGPGSWTAVVSMEMFRAAERVFRDPKRKSGGGGRRTALLSGVAQCGCGGEVSSVHRSSEASANYRCRECGSTWPRVWVDGHLKGFVIAGAMRPEVLTLMAEPSSATEGLTAKLAAVEGRERELMDDYADGVVNREQFRSMMDRVTATKKAVQAQLARQGVGNLTAELIQAGDLAETWDGLTLGQQTVLVTTFFERIELVPRHKHRMGVRHVRLWPQGTEVPLAVE